jgi:hypothetical protein
VIDPKRFGWEEDVAASRMKIELVIDQEAMKAAFREAFDRFVADREEKPVKAALDYVQSRMREFVRTRTSAE